VDNVSRSVCFVHHEVSMSLRSSTEDENEWSSFRTRLPLMRHSRAGGNPGLSCTELAWIPAFAGMTEPSRFVAQIILAQVFSKDPSAAKPQLNFGISRAKGAKEERCHFERREKSFLDPSHSLGMTGRGPSLCDLGVLGARNIRIREAVG
jgi:hypothetical protein